MYKRGRAGGRPPTPPPCRPARSRIGDWVSLYVRLYVGDLLGPLDARPGAGDCLRRSPVRRSRDPGPLEVPAV